MSTSNEAVKLIIPPNEPVTMTREDLLKFQRNAIAFAIQAIDKAGGDNRAIHMKAIKVAYTAELKKMEGV